MGTACKLVGVSSSGRKEVLLPGQAGLFGRSHAGLVLVLALLVGAALSLSAAASGSKRVLILYSYGRGFSPFGTVAAGFETELAQISKEPIEFQEASVEMPGSAAGVSDETAVAYLGALFTNHEPDLVVPFGSPAVKFALRQRTQFFPKTPLLLAGVEDRHLKAVTLDSNTAAITSSFDLPGVVENVMRLWPATTNIAVVLGSSSVEKFWKAELAREFAPFANRVAFSWLDQLTLAEMQQKVAHLPAHSAIFFVSVFADAAGVPYQHDRGLKAIHEAANAPVVGLFEEDVGLGNVGGPQVRLQDQSREAARVAVRILEGESPGTIPRSSIGVGKPVYDGRELKRWGVSEARLPPGSEVRFREESFAGRYRWHMLWVAGICALESALIVGLITALNRRRQTERSLRESEERMKLAASAAELGLWEWDMKSDQVWVAGRSVDRIGHSNGHPSDYSRFLRTVHPDDREAVASAVAKAVNGDGEYEHVHRRIQSDGQIRWISGRGRVEYDGEHKPLRLRGVGLDITSRKVAEEHARESERRFLLIANTAPVLIWTSGPDKLCNFFNKPWLEFTGRTLEQETGTGWTEGVHPEDVTKCLKTYEESFDLHQPFTMEYRLRRRDGQYRWLSDHGVPRYDENHNFMGYIGSCVDVTGRKQAEAEAQRWRHELAHVSRVSTLGELAGSLAHELNQPLTAILSNAQAAQRFLNGGHAEPEEVREILKDIAAEGRRAGEIIVGMRAMLRKDQGQMVSLDVNEVINEVLGITRSDIIVRQVAVVTHLGTGLPRVKGDRIQLQQVLLNLILNACDAMSETPASERRLTLETECSEGGEIQVSVADCGPGFPAETLTGVFEPFRTTKPNGLGLGLPICRSIINAHGGRLWVSNPSGRGATVRFAVAGLKEATK
jgi:PAS domain S-box-containing protein